MPRSPRASTSALLARLDATIDCACGITRCRNYDGSSGLTYEAHVEQCTDSGLRFHSDAGATIGELVAGYRPDDAPNLCY